MYRCLVRIMASLATLLVAAHAHDFEAGWVPIQTAGATPRALLRRAAAASVSRHRRDPGRSSLEGSHRDRQPGASHRCVGALGRRLHGAGPGGRHAGLVPDE